MNEKPYLSADFQREVQKLVELKGHRRTAELLRSMNIPFEDTYYLIFGRAVQV